MGLGHSWKWGCPGPCGSRAASPGPIPLRGQEHLPSHNNHKCGDTPQGPVGGGWGGEASWDERSCPVFPGTVRKSQPHFLHNPGSLVCAFKFEKSCLKRGCLGLSTSDFGGPTCSMGDSPGHCRAASLVPTHSMPGAPLVVMNTDVLRHRPVSPRGRVIPQETPWSEATTSLSMVFPHPPHSLLGAGGLTSASYHAAVHVRKQSLGLSHP